MKHFVFLGFLLLFLFACNIDPNKFTLTGETSGLEDGTKVFLLHLKANEVLDSTIIKNNTFVISGALDSFPLKTVLMTNRGDVSGYVWLTPGEIVFDASSGSFANAFVSGSGEQVVQEHFATLIDSLSTLDPIPAAVGYTVTTYPGSRVSVSLLAEYHRDMPYIIVDSLFQILSAKNQSTEEGLHIAEYLELNQNLSVGDVFADFEMENLNGVSTLSSKSLGRLTLLHFWASWCDTCRIDNDSLASLYNTYRSEGLSFFSVSMDFDKHGWKNAIRQDSLSWTQVSDLKGRNNKASQIYGVSRVPDYFLIDSNGIIVAHNDRVDSISVVIETFFLSN